MVSENRYIYPRIFFIVASTCGCHVWYTRYRVPPVQSCSTAKCSRSFLFTLDCPIIPVVWWFANLLYSIPKVLNSCHFAYRSSRLCLHVCLVKCIINLSITSKYLLKKQASGTYLLASFSVQRGGGGRACFSHLHMHLITAEFHSLRILLIYFHTLITPNIDTKW